MRFMLLLEDTLIIDLGRNHLLKKLFLYLIMLYTQKVIVFDIFKITQKFYKIICNDMEKNSIVIDLWPYSTCDF